MKWSIFLYIIQDFFFYQLLLYPLPFLNTFLFVLLYYIQFFLLQERIGYFIIFILLQSIFHEFFIHPLLISIKFNILILQLAMEIFRLLLFAQSARYLFHPKFINSTLLRWYTHEILTSFIIFKCKKNKINVNNFIKILGAWISCHKNLFYILTFT